MPAGFSVAQIQAQIEQELQSSPDVRVWGVLVRSLIQDVYLEIWEKELWPFRYREAPFWTYPDFTIAQGPLALFGATQRRVFRLQTPGTFLGGVMFPAAQIAGGVFEEHLEQLVGAEVGLENLTNATDISGGNWAEGPFTIQRVRPAGPDLLLWLDSRCNCTAHASSTVWNIRFPRYRLPFDFEGFGEECGIKDDQGMQLAFLDHKRFRYFEQGAQRPPKTSGGSPVHWTWDEGFETAAPMDNSVFPNFWTTQTLAPVEFEHRINQHIRETITGIPQAGGGGFIANQLYRFAVCWQYEGRFGPLSNVVEFTASTTNHQFILQNLPQLPHDAAFAPDVDYGWVLAVWVATGDGGFFLHSYIDPPPNVGSVLSEILLTDPMTQTGPWKRFRYDDVYPAGGYRYVKLWPRPAAHTRLQLRYLRRPRALVDAVDTVDGIPEPFARYLVYEVCARLAAGPAVGSSPAVSSLARFQGMARQKYRGMMQHYFPGRYQRAQRAGILDQDLTRWPISAPIDWNGDT